MKNVLCALVLVLAYSVAADSSRTGYDQYTLYYNSLDAGIKQTPEVSGKGTSVMGHLDKAISLKKGEFLRIKAKEFADAELKNGTLEFYMKPDWKRVGAKGEPKVRDIVFLHFDGGYIGLQKIGNSLNLNSHFGKYRHVWYGLPKEFNYDGWHHVMITWQYADGFTFYQLYLDGKECASFYNSLLKGKLKSLHFSKDKFADAGVSLNEIRLSKVVRHDKALVKTAPLPPSGRLIDKSPNLTMWFEEPSVKVMQNAAPPGDKLPAAGIELSAARGEVEAFQLVFLPKQDMNNVTIVFSDLLGPDGAILDKSVCQALAVECVKVILPSGRFGRAGEMPDPLPPRKQYQFAKGKANPVWLNVRIPYGVKAGIYSSKVKITSSTGVYNIPFSVHVRDFDLPIRFNQKHVALGWFQRLFKAGKYKDKDELYRLANLNMAKHRLAGWASFGRTNSGGGTKEFKVNTALLDKYVDWLKPAGMYILPLNLVDWISHKGTHCWQNGATWQGLRMFADEEKAVFNPEFVAAFTKAARMLTDELRTRNLLEFATLYYQDEMDWTDKATLVKSVALAKLIKQVAPELKIIQTKYPHSDLLDYIDIWCIHDKTYIPHIEIIEQARKKGAEIWLYQNNIPLIDYSGMRVRVFPQLLKKYKFDGSFSWWGLCAYGYNKVKDPWKDPWYGSAGVGVLLYPARNEYERAYGPITSIRWELFREGVEDAEYLHLLDIAIAEYEQQGSRDQLLQEAKALRKEAEAFVGWMPDDLKQNYSLDARKLTNYHRRLGVLLEKMKHTLPKVKESDYVILNKLVKPVLEKSGTNCVAK